MEPALGGRPAAPPASAPVGQEFAFGVGKVVAHAFAAWWHHALVFSAMTLMADLPMLVAFPLAGVPIPGMTAPSPNPFDRAGAAPPPAVPPALWLAYLATMLLFAVEAGAITHGVIRHLAGRPVSLGAMIATGFRRLLPLLVVGLLCYVLVLVGMMLLLVPGLFLASALIAALPAAVAERPGILGALRRSFSLTKGHRLAIFAASLVLFVAAFCVAMVGSFLLPLLAASFSPMLGTLLGLAVNVLFGTLLWVAPGVVYHDLRVAKEGASTAQLAAVFE